MLISFMILVSKKKEIDYYAEHAAPCTIRFSGKKCSHVSTVLTQFVNWKTEWFFHVVVGHE